MHYRKKDSAESFEQKSWEFAVETYERLKIRIKNFSHNPSMVNFANERIAELLEKYPQLKK